MKQINKIKIDVFTKSIIEFGDGLRADIVGMSRPYKDKRGKVKIKMVILPEKLLMFLYGLREGYLKITLPNKDIQKIICRPFLTLYRTELNYKGKMCEGKREGIDRDINEIEVE